MNSSVDSFSLTRSTNSETNSASVMLPACKLFVSAFAASALVIGMSDWSSRVKAATAHSSCLTMKAAAAAAMAIARSSVDEYQRQHHASQRTRSPTSAQSSKRVDKQGRACTTHGASQFALMSNLSVLALHAACRHATCLS